MGPSGKNDCKMEVPATPAGMDEIIKKMDGKEFRVLGEAFTYSIDLHNYLLGKGVISDLIQPDGLELITRSYKKTDYHDRETIAWYLRMFHKGEINTGISYIVKDNEMRLRDVCRLRYDISLEKTRINQRIKVHMHRNGECIPEDRFGKSPDISTMRVQKYIIDELTTSQIETLYQS